MTVAFYAEECWVWGRYRWFVGGRRMKGLKVVATERTTTDPAFSSAKAETRCALRTTLVQARRLSGRHSGERGPSAAGQ